MFIFVKNHIIFAISFLSTYFSVCTQIEISEIKKIGLSNDMVWDTGVGGFESTKKCLSGPKTFYNVIKI